MSASRRIVLSSPSIPSRTVSLLTALDLLDLEATKVHATASHEPPRIQTDNNEAEIIKSSIERLELDKKAGAHAVHPFMPTARPAAAKTKERTLNGDTVWRNSPSIGAEQEKTSEEVLPIYTYRDYKPKPSIVYTRHEEETNDLIDGLRSGPVAMDLEWCVPWKADSTSNIQTERKTAVVQIADGAGLILVVQVNKMRRFPKRLQALIESAKIPKVGVNILSDGKKLFRDYGILARNLVELGSVALTVDPALVWRRKIVSLAKLVAHYCGKTLAKDFVRTSDWESTLTPRQRVYAANDVHASLMVYSELLKIGKINSCSLDDASAQYTREVTWSSVGSISEKAPFELREGMRPRYFRAYECWHHERLSLEDMCLKLRLRGKGPVGGSTSGVALKPGTVITYIIGALQNDPELEYNLDKLVELVQMDLDSWSRHRNWITRQKCA